MMDSRNTLRLYEDLSWIFPIFTPIEHYLQETEEFSRLIQQQAHRPVETLLHLGCGAGHNDFTFKRFFRVTGIDSSRAMIELARKLNPEVDYGIGDLRTVKLDRRFDAVTAIDSLDYLLTPDDWQAACATAFHHLNPGGVFFFLVEATREDFEQNRCSVWRSVRGEVEIVTLENCYDPDPEDTTYETTFVHLIRRAGKLDVQTDIHTCGLFPARFIEDKLREAGLDARRLEYRPPPSAVQAYSSGPCGKECYVLLLGLKPI
ncbi:MAG: class I SAM-dependent methyltransferase [Acidobacteriota bacterium]